jgi:hypothetical protein
MARSTRWRFSSLTRAAPVSTRDTVGTETPALRATSAITGGLIMSAALYFTAPLVTPAMIRR